MGKAWAYCDESKNIRWVWLKFEKFSKNRGKDKEKNKEIKNRAIKIQ